MARRGLNKPIVGDGVQIQSGTQTLAGVGGTSLTTPGENPGVLGELVHVYNTVASSWVGTRYFAVDYDLGNDENAGFSDVSMALAGTVALKTIEELLTRVPRNGHGTTAVIAIKARAGGATYLKKDGVTPDRLNIDGFYGYFHFLVRGTGTVATASAVAFANDTNDKIALGAQIVTGTNAAGYNPAAPISNNTFNTVPGGLPAEPALLGKRIRFSSTTTTVALRNVTAMIHFNDPDTITVANNLPAVPVTTDTFYIEEPATTVDGISVNSTTPNVSTIATLELQGIHVAGLRTSGTTTASRNIINGPASCIFSFVDSLNTQIISFNIRNFTGVQFIKNYVDELGTPILTGVGIRSIGGVDAQRGTFLNIASSSLAGNGSADVGRMSVTDALTANLGEGSYFFKGVFIKGTGTGTSSGRVFTNLVGRGNNFTAQKLRIVSPAGNPACGINISLAHCTLYGIDITNMGANALMELSGVGCCFSINDVSGSTGNTGVGLSIGPFGGKDAHITMGTLDANTFTGAAGKDIEGAPGAGFGPFYVHADYIRTDLRDDNGNHIQGLGGCILGPTVVDGVSTLPVTVGQYKLVRKVATGLRHSSNAGTSVQASTSGVTQSAGDGALTQVVMIVNGGGTWIQFDAVPTVGNIAYLSTVNAGNAQDTPPANTGTNYKLRIGRVLKVSGTLGYVNFNPETLAVIADGNP